MLNVITVLSIYVCFYFLFTLLGVGSTRLIFPSRSYLANLLSPVFGFTLFCLISTGLLYYMTGAEAGRLGLQLTTLLAAMTYLISLRQPAPMQWARLARSQLPGFLSGLIFLLPLLLARDIGIFAINGADFGSYAGWGQYFQDYTLKQSLPIKEPVNFTLKAFTNLQQEITKADGKWRIGNISLFTALCSLLPSYWPTLYTISIAFLLAQFTIAIQLFARIALFQKRSNALKLSYLSILLATVMWLGSAHYTPNVLGLTYTLLLVSLFLLANRLKPRLIIGTSLLVAGLVLLYPESFMFFPIILGMQLLMRDKFLWHPFTTSLFKSRILIVGIMACLTIGLAYLWTFNAFAYCMRHLFNIVGYDRPGDYVYIHFYSYLSQGIGFIDYHSILKENRNSWLKITLILNYIAAFILLAYGLLGKFNHSREKLRKRAYLILFACVLLLSLPICAYFYGHHYLIAWRALLTLSPYTWLLICIAGLNAWSMFKINPNLKFAKVTVLAFSLILATDIFFRIGMIKNITVGTNHAAIFGEGLQKSTAYLEKYKNDYDIAFIDYEGSGTIQAGWEFYAQNASYLFPQHGSGVNEYQIDPIRNKRILLLSDGYRKVHELKGFKEPAIAFEGRTVTLLSDHDYLQPYSSTWIYLKNDAKKSPELMLPGMPGLFLLWLREDAKACLSMQASSRRDNAILSISFNGEKPMQKTMDEVNNEKICHGFKKGLNTIRLQPLFTDKETLLAQQEFVKEKRASKQKLTEQERGLVKIYSTLHAVNPLSSPTPSDWNTTWNLITPPNKYPFNPHIVFQRIVIEKV